MQTIVLRLGMQTKVLLAINAVINVYTFEFLD